MNYTLFILGWIFLCNPEIATVDLLPDAVGFFLLARALAPTAPLSPSAEEAVGGFRKLGWISLLKTALLIPVFSITDPGVRLLFAFSFSVLRLAFIFPAFSRYFDALTYFADRSDVPALSTRPIRFFCLSGFVIRHALGLLPEMLYLYVNDDNIYDAATYPMAAYYPAVLLMTVLLSLILGVIWLIVMLRHTRRLRRNTALNQTVAAEIAAVPHSQADTIRRGAGPGLLLLSLSFFAQIAFNIDGVPVIPTVVAPALFLIGVRYFSRFMGLPRRCLRLPIAATAAGVLQYGAILLFTARHQEQAAIYFAKVKTPFLLPMIGEIVYGGLWIACLSLCLFPLLKRFLAEHTGAYWETAYREHNAAVLRDRQHRSFLLTLCLALSIVTAVGNAVSYALLYVLPWLRLITAGVALVTAILFRTLTVSARQAMEEKYAEPAP